MQHVLPKPSSSRRRRWGSDCSARRQKSAVVASHSKSPEIVICRSALTCVLEAIYAAFGIGWDDMFGIDQGGRDLAEEAIWLARVLLQLMPGEAEVQSLLALMLHCEARRAARRAPDGRYVPLSEQNPKQWSCPMIEEAERHLAEAFKRGTIGKFQLEAAIQSVHAERDRTGRTDWTAIALFYEQLIRISPAL